MGRPVRHLRHRFQKADPYERAAERHTNGDELPAADYPTYFRALEIERTIAATDANGDPRTAEFSSYFQPLGVTSVIEAPIRRLGTPRRPSNSSGMRHPAAPRGADVHIPVRGLSFAPALPTMAQAAAGIKPCKWR